MLYFSWQLSFSFQMPDRCFMWMWHGTQLLKALCNTLRYDDISMLLLLRMLCVMNVLWMCYGYVMNVLWMCYGCDMDVLWMCYGCVMGVLWMCYGCVMGVSWVCHGCVMGVSWMCHGCVMDVSWMCHGCVMDVSWMCYGCMRDGWMMDILYLLCNLYCKWYCNCNIVVVCDITVMLIFVFCFSGLFKMTIKP